MMGCGLCVLWGAVSAYDLVYTERTLHRWVFALEAMRVHCACMRSTPEQVFLSGAAHIFILKEIAGAKTLQDIERLLKTERLPQMTYATVYGTLESIWNGTPEEQKDKLRFAVSQLTQQWQTAREKSKDKARLHMTLGIFSGLCAGIVCI